MFTSKRIRIAGAAVSLGVLFAGHVTAHADVTSDATVLADATASNSIEYADATAANASNPNTTCDATAAGQPENSNVDAAGQVAVAAHDSAEAVITCFSFTNLTYTMWTSLTIQDYVAATNTWVNVTGTGCFTASGPVQSNAGLATVALELPLCTEGINLGVTRQHVHRALVRFNTNTGFAGTPTPSVDVWTLNY